MFKKIQYIIIGLILISCSGNQEEVIIDPLKGLTVKEKKAALEGALRRSAQKEQMQIRDYLKRHQIQAEESNTGVHFCVYKKGNGTVVKEDLFVEMSYSVTNLKGDTIYTVKSDQPERFQVEKSEKESGLHEVIKGMKVGDKAIVVIPSNRAHGISGDEGKIPPLTTVVYNLNIHSVQ